MTGPHLAIMGIALLYLVAIRWSLAVHGILHVDNARDLAVAWRIANGHDFPLVGPMQTGLFHLGPLYSYLSAIPLALFGTATSLTLFISLLSLISLYFGYRLGDLLFGREAGLVFAALLASDFLATISSVQGGHTALIISSCLMYLYATAVAILRREARYLGWAIVAGAVMVQMHLVAAALLPLLAAALLLPMGGKKGRSVAAGASVAVVLFLPYLVHQASQGWKDLHQLPAFLRASAPAALRAIPVTSLPGLFLRYNAHSASMADGFSQFVTSPWVRLPAVMCLRVIAIAALIGLAVAVYEVARSGRRLPHALILAWLLLGWFIIPFLRPSLPWYLMFPVYPAHLLLAAVAIARLGNATRRLGVLRMLAPGLVGVVFLLSPLLMAQTFSRFAHQGRLEIPAWLMTDILQPPAASPGRFVIPYLGTRQEEQMVRYLGSLPEADRTIYQRIHGIPLWSVIFSRASLFLLYPPFATADDPSRPHVVGLLREDLPGQPIGKTREIGPMVLVTAPPLLEYARARYSVVEYPRWSHPDYDDAGWRRIGLPGYAVPNPLEYPPWNYPRSMTWERRPVYVRVKLVRRDDARTLLGVSFPTFTSGDEAATVERVFLNGVEVEAPSRRSSELILYDITGYLRAGNNTLALVIDGGPHFILDLFTVSLKD